MASHPPLTDTASHSAVVAGLFTTAPKELLVEQPVTATGTVPAWLCGDMVKQSASKYEEGDRGLTHTFDGFGKVLRWRFRNQQVSLQARFLRSNFFNQSEQRHDICPSRLFGTTNPFQDNLPAIIDNCTDNLNVNVHQFGPDGDVMLTSDFEAGYSIDLDSLITSPHKWADTWGKAMDKIAAAHPSTTSSGETVNFVMRVNPLAMGGLGKHHIMLYTVGASNVRTLIRSIPVSKLPYIHSFTVTENYVVLLVAPFTWKLAGIIEAKPMLSNVNWNPEEKTSFMCIPLNTSQPVVVHTAPAVFGFHHVNGYEDINGSIVMDILSNDKSSGQMPVAGFTLKNMRNKTARDTFNMTSEFRRYTITHPATPGNATHTVIPLVDSQGNRYANAELPVINPKMHAHRHCFIYAWAPHSAGSSSFDDMAIIKRNVCNTSAPLLKWFRTNHFPSEPTMVPRPNATREDDGVVLTAVWDGDRMANYLVIIDAHTMSTLATLYCEEDWSHLMSFGIHGKFVQRDVC